MAADPEFKTLQTHADLGGDTKIVVALLTAAILLQVLIDRGIVSKLSEVFKNTRGWAARALAGLTIVLAIAAGVFTLLTGHEGAKATFGEEGRDAARAGDVRGSDFDQQPGRADFDGDAR